MLITTLYALALPGYWLFDDWPNLVGLNQVDGVLSSLRFITSGEAGPLGRPLALATFALQAEAWDDHPEAMLRVNFAIHFLAVVAVFFLAAGLSRIRLPDDARKAWWIGAAVALVWGFAPFLATTHLMIIQRMTSLSGLFLFAGLAMFVWAHMIRGQRLRHLTLVAGLGLGTLLATLSKESGALLPLLALVVLLLWIPREMWLKEPMGRWLIALLVLLPSVLLGLYLANGFVETLYRGDYGARREFTPWERLLTQPVIVMDYLKNLLFPRAIAATPFMDQIPHSEGWLKPPATLLAWMFWGALAALAIALRKPALWLLFGLSFFLVGHVLESTHIGLELYFAHRNYVPAFGVFFGLVFFAMTVSPPHFRLASTVVFAYILLTGLVLFQVTSYWNDEPRTAELWVDYNPHTVRGAQLLAWQYQSMGRFVAARQTLERAADAQPRIALLQIQRTDNCVDNIERFPDLLEEVLANLENLALYNPIAAIELRRFSEREDPSPLCPPRDHETLIRMAGALLDNPVYARQDFARSQLHLATAFSLVHLNEDLRAVAYFQKSLRLHPDLEVAFRALSLQANLGDYDGAFAFLNELNEHVPNDPLRHMLWQTRLDDFREILQKSREIDEGNLLNETPANSRI
ncbi:tetratricopeptide repeat protein [Thioalkalivibrio denitrificans]|nr:tetratricopeptide repeat protein [Thioalkalivibrio denitrificans]